MKYDVKIRFQGHISWVTVDANNAHQAKELVKAQYGAYSQSGPKTEVISCNVSEKQ